eukprot:359258-Chlamydomonas_euryale.AAC.10
MRTTRPTAAHRASPVPAGTEPRHLHHLMYLVEAAFQFGKTLGAKQLGAQSCGALGRGCLEGGGLGVRPHPLQLLCRLPLTTSEWRLSPACWGVCQATAKPDSVLTEAQNGGLNAEYRLSWQ